MLRANVTETLHGDVGGDGVDTPPSWGLDDGDDTGDPQSFGGCVADDGDNLSIDLDTLYAFLDKEQSVSFNVQEDALQANQIEGSSHFEKASSPRDGTPEALLGLPLEVEELEHSRCTSSGNLDASNFKEGNELMSSYEDSKCLKNCSTRNYSSEYMKPYESLMVDSSSSTNHALNWLSLSTLGHQDYVIDSVGCSMVPSMSGSFEFQSLQTQSPETLMSEISAHRSIYGSQYAEHANNLLLGCKKRSKSVQGGGDSLVVTAVSCKDKTFISSSNHFQRSQAADSSHFMSVETYNFGSVQNDIYSDAMLNTGNEEENTCPTAVDPSNDLGPNSSNVLNVELDNGLERDSYSAATLNVEMNNDWAAELTWNDWSHLPESTNSLAEVYTEAAAENTSMQSLPGKISQSYISSGKQHMITGKVKEEDQEHAPSYRCTGYEVKPFLQQEDTSFVDSDSSLSEMSCNDTNNVGSINAQCASNGDLLQVCFSNNYVNDNGIHLADASKILTPASQVFIQNKKQKIYPENAKRGQLVVSQNQSQIICQAPPKDLSEHSVNVDEDPDICIIDDLGDSHPPCPAVPKKSRAIPLQCGFDDSYYSPASSSRFLVDDEKLTFQIALQDLAQSKSEASLPEGVLAVPLLRHQRIALSWMVQKETLNLHCSGGILADDQGLGKTVSTIALVLMERSPLSKSCTTPAKDEFEALNLDEDVEFTNSSCPKLGNSVVQPSAWPLKSEDAPVR